MKPALVVALLLALFQPGITPASMTTGPGPNHAEGADCPHAPAFASGDVCEHGDCQCEHACSSVAIRPGQVPGVVAARRPVRTSTSTPALRTGFPRTLLRPPIR